MKNKSLFIASLLTVCFHFPISAQNVVTFTAKDIHTGQPVGLESVYVENVSQNSDTILINPLSLNLNSLTAVTGSKRIGPTVTEDSQLSLSYPCPSPFEETVAFHVSTFAETETRVSVVDILGREISEWDEKLGPGKHEFRFTGAALARGIYLINVRTGSASRTIKLLKLGGKRSGVLNLSLVGSEMRPDASISKTQTANAAMFRFTGYTHAYWTESIETLAAGGETLVFNLSRRTEQPVLPALWKGFNLLGKFALEWSNEGYVEQDFEWIREFGFNFVRLPVDYRTYTKAGDWTGFNESELTEIDRAVEWGMNEGIHVCLNLHRAPGFCINPPPQALPTSENLDLWTDKEAQRVFALHWGMFARRYKDVPTDALSFNLVNEPANVNAAGYVNAMKDAIAAIRCVSPDRLILADGIEVANQPVEELIAYHVVQSPHFYQPFQLTHYKAEWVAGSDSWPVPVWPVLKMPSYLYGSGKAPWNTALKLRGGFLKDTEVSMVVHQVSTSLDLVVNAGGSPVFQHAFRPGPGTGEWKDVVYVPQWNIYQNIYDRNYSFTLNTDASELSFEAVQGDWMTFNEIGINPPASSGRWAFRLVPGIGDWGVPQGVYTVSQDGALTVTGVPTGFESVFSEDPLAFIEPWIALKSRGIAVMGGEWGVYNKTPHDVTLAFMRDRLQAFQTAGIGWALWNFRGSLGPLDSDRTGMVYEYYKGHRLDREMLDLLRKDW